MSAMAPDGLPMVSVNRSLVRSVMAAANASVSRASTNVVSIPKRARVTENWVTVPP